MLFALSALALSLAEINGAVTCEQPCAGDFLLQLTPRGPKLELPIGWVTKSLSKSATQQLSSVLGSTPAAYGNASAHLSDFVGYDFDVSVAHGEGRWPCTQLDGNLEKPFKYAGESNTISANFTTDMAGEPIYACSYSTTLNIKH